MLKSYCKIAFRGFWRHKLFTLINVIGLSIGASAALVFYLIIQFDLSFNTSFPDHDRVFRVVTNFTHSGEKGYNGGVVGALPEAVKNEVPGVTATVPFFILDEFTLNQRAVLIPEISKIPVKFKEQQDKILADDRYFAMFPHKWLAGSAGSALNEPFKVVLTAEQAQKYFPGTAWENMLGKEVIYGDSIRTTVTGIVEPYKGNTDLRFSDFISYSTGNAVDAFKNNLTLTQWGGTTPSSQLYVKLGDHVSPAAIDARLNALLSRNMPPLPAGMHFSSAFHLQRISDVHFQEEYATYKEPTASKATLYGLSFIALFLLALGCINFINLTTAQAAQRAREIGIRKTIGSTRRQLIGQLLCETFLITLFAIIISCVLAPTLLRLFAGFIPAGVQADYLHRPDLIGFLFLLTMTISLLSGFYPAFVLSAYKPVQVLKNQMSNQGRETRSTKLRKSLTVSQLVIAQFFIMATLLVSKQVYYALHKDLGFKKEAILIVQTPWSNKSPERKQVYINEIRALPQVTDVSLGGASPSSDNTHSTGIIYHDGQKEIKTDVQERFGDENYIKVYNIKLLAGRNLRPGDSGRAFLMNATYARVLGFKTPAEAVGTVLEYNGNRTQVAGVVGDFYYRSLHSPIKPLVIISSTNSYFSSALHIALKPQTAGGKEWQTAIAAIQASWKKLYPDDDFNMDFFDESIARFYQSEQHTSTLLGWATGLSIAISGLGLLGLALYTTNQRRKEIGIRKVLGASVTQIVTLLSREMVLLVALAFAIVTPLAWWAMNKWMEGFADRTAISWWIFALSGAGMLLTVLAVSSVQTVKAALTNPVKSLKTE